MKRLLRSKSPTRPEPEDGSRIVEIGDQAAGDVFEALSSDTTRDVLAAIYDNPGTASEIADAVGTSLQNVRYHLTKLREADLIEVADTWYSEQGNEMKVYAPTNESVVMLAGDDATRSSIRETLSRLIGVVGVLAVVSVVVDGVVVTPGAPTWHSSRPTSPPPGVPALDPVALSPGTVFFVGGLVSILTIVLWSLSTRLAKGESLRS